MEMELDLVINQTSCNFFFKMTITKGFANSKQRFHQIFLKYFCKSLHKEISYAYYLGVLWKVLNTCLFA